eukprot:CAMPEP_0182502718 /NCGR_PEP_ID=MMETSP1321-20130603/13965_1 /TAXON_ID=91990 /ORGANISM="Bolidomonas sp., Strain RCC1657" /LENGTH=83 /DNA_ID=CAMNT_0024707711 /DNA_START=223 /DNA_END=474 /DNA_ORIENTATION=-
MPTLLQPVLVVGVNVLLPPGSGNLLESYFPVLCHPQVPLQVAVVVNEAALVLHVAGLCDAPEQPSFVFHTRELLEGTQTPLLP